MSIRRRRVAVGVFLVLALSLLAMFGLSLLSHQRPDLGPQNGKLRPCPETPNCVCSFDTGDEHGIEPFVAGPRPAATFDQLRSLLGSMPRVEIVTDNENYLHAEFTTSLLRFVDDAEFLLDETADVIHVRSASRVGRSDFGTNRQRVEMLRQRLADEPPAAE